MLIAVDFDDNNPFSISWQFELYNSFNNVGNFHIYSTRRNARPLQLTRACLKVMRVLLMAANHFYLIYYQHMSQCKEG